MLTCPYCGSPAVCVDSAEIYRGRSYGFAWVCGRFPECDSYVGCHKGTQKPLGRLADKSLRIAKKVAHDEFDKLWKGGPMSRKEAYEWLALALGIEVDACHIGEFDLETCRKVQDFAREATGASA